MSAFPTPPQQDSLLACCETSSVRLFSLYLSVFFLFQSCLSWVLVYFSFLLGLNFSWSSRNLGLWSLIFPFTVENKLYLTISTIHHQTYQKKHLGEEAGRRIIARPTVADYHKPQIAHNKNNKNIFHNEDFDNALGTLCHGHPRRSRLPGAQCQCHKTQRRR